MFVGLGEHMAHICRGGGHQTPSGWSMPTVVLDRYSTVRYSLQFAVHTSPRISQYNVYERIRHRPEHQVCGIGDSAIKTARIVLVMRTFEGPVLRATQNKLSFTMRHAAPNPPAGPVPKPEPGDLAKNHH